MPLKEVRLSIIEERLPRSMQTFLQEADVRIEQFIADRRVRISGFVPSDFVTVYHALNSVVDADVATGSMFCEWGSGFGIVAMMAAHFDFESYGIEIEGSLVEAAREMSDEFELPVEFIQGSFVPEGAESLLEGANQSDVMWLSTESDEAYAEMGLTVRDFDLIYAFPWPGEEDMITNLFEQYASPGALLLTYGHLDGVRIRRKVLSGR